MIKPPIALTPYLYTNGSLTALLERRSGKPLLVEIVSESYVLLSLSQKKLLNLPLHKPHRAKTRHVMLYGNQSAPWVHASSIFPQKSLQGNAKRLAYLKNTPIGYILFKQKHVVSSKRTVYFNGHWNRRTIYDWQGRKLLIAECFLTNFD